MLTIEQKILYTQFSIFYFLVCTPLTLLILLFWEGNAIFSTPQKLKKLFSKLIKAEKQLNTVPIDNKVIENLTLTPKETILNEAEKKAIEEKAMDLVKAYENQKGRTIEDVSTYYIGYDIKSTDINGNARMIEIKGKATSGKVILTVNEWNTAKNHGDSYYLYIVENISKNQPILRIIQNPYNKLSAKENKFQYTLSKDKYTSKAKEIMSINTKK